MVRTIHTLTRFPANAQPGQARLAVFSFLFARHSGGEFSLRIEDTGPEGNKAPDDGAAEGLKWLGLAWDGDVLRQSERSALYESLAARLVKEGRAYPCYCTLEEIEERNKNQGGEGRQHHYDGKCSHLTADEIRKYEAEGRKPGIRLLARNESVSFNDFRKGETTVPAGTVGDFIILRSNRTPVGVFAETVDAAEAGVTHLFRNEEHLSVVARQLMLFRALGAPAPVIYHLPPLTGQDGRKLQNQDCGPLGLDPLQAKKAGYLPESVFNHLALCGWKSPDGRELLGRDELVRLFTPEGLAREPDACDAGRLDWISKHVIINENIERIFELSLPYFRDSASGEVRGMLDDPEKKDLLKKATDLVRGYCGRLSCIVEHALCYLTDDYPFDEEARSVLAKKEAMKILPAFREWIAANPNRMDENVFGGMVAEISGKTGVHGKALFQTLKAALTGRTDGPDIYYLIPVIGNERALLRIERAAGVVKIA